MLMVYIKAKNGLCAIATRMSIVNTWTFIHSLPLAGNYLFNLTRAVNCVERPPKLNMEHTFTKRYYNYFDLAFLIGAFPDPIREHVKSFKVPTSKKNVKQTVKHEDLDYFKDAW